MGPYNVVETGKEGYKMDQTEVHYRELLAIREGILLAMYGYKQQRKSIKIETDSKTSQMLLRGYPILNESEIILLGLVDQLRFQLKCLQKIVRKTGHTVSLVWIDGPVNRVADALACCHNLGTGWFQQEVLMSHGKVRHAIMKDLAVNGSREEE